MRKKGALTPTLSPREREAVPTIRVRALNDAPFEKQRSFVLYWMTSFRRARSNFALDRAIELARSFERPLVVLEPLRVGYPFASERIHAFILQGMADNARAFAKSPIHHHPYVETKAGDGKGLLEALAAKACAVIGDDWPGFFIPTMQRAAAAKLDVRFEVVDSNGLYPMHHTTRVFTTAHSFRTHLQKVLPPHLHQLPNPEPLKRLELPPLPKLPSEFTKRWPRAALDEVDLAALPIDHTVKRVDFIGGSTTARARLDHFVTHILGRYDEARSEPEVDGTSKLSPYLHFGHLSTHEIFERLKPSPKWSPDDLGKSIGGAKAGWWKFDAASEAFLDELVTWRELAFNMSSHRPAEFTSMSSLPSWALQTIKAHATDKRAYTYSLQQLERGQTHDPLWNAAMGQLRTEGWFHNNVRMLWGKKIYEWSKSASDALTAMDTLMSKYSLDGRDPVSWSGALWVLGRYDRPWGPERPVFGKLRYMTSQNFARKVSVKNYVANYARELTNTARGS